MPFCNYCNKEYSLKGISFHEKYCKNNPNRKEYPVSNKIGNHIGTKGKIAWNRGKTKDTDKRILNATFKYKETLKTKYGGHGTFYGKHHTEKTKKKMSEIRKEMIKNHPESCFWNNTCKKVSEPCEYLKKKLRENNISFVEEYKAFDDYGYRIDIAWPDIKVGIEVNGMFHYNFKDMSLKPYYQKRHNIFESRGWKIYEILYSRVYTEDIIALIKDEKIDFYDKDYNSKYLSYRQYQEKIKNEKERNLEKEKEEKRKIEVKKKNLLNKIFDGLEFNSGIDFNHFGWLNKAKNYIKREYSSNAEYSLIFQTNGIYTKLRKYLEKYRPSMIEKAYKRQYNN